MNIIIPGIIAHHYPTKTIHLHFASFQPVEGLQDTLIIIKDGAYYMVKSIQNGIARAVDPFQIKAQIPYEYATSPIINGNDRED